MGDDRKPLPPDVLASALNDCVHKNRLMSEMKHCGSAQDLDEEEIAAIMGPQIEAAERLEGLAKRLRAGVVDPVLFFVVIKSNWPANPQVVGSYDTEAEAKEAVEAMAKADPDANLTVCVKIPLEWLFMPEDGEPEWVDGLDGTPLD